LLEDVEIIMVSSARDLGRLAVEARESPARGIPPKAQASEAVLVGNPDFNASPSRTATAQVAAGLPDTGRRRSRNLTAADRTRNDAAAFERLPWNDALFRKLESWFRNNGMAPRVLAGAHANEAAVFKLSGPRILQFVTHGVHVTATAPGSEPPLLRAYLALAGVNQWRPGLSSPNSVGDGKLTAYEAAGLDLTGTELVNLTACDTASGDVTPDGVVGLQHAFLVAGASSVIASLWTVPVTETLRQVRLFYQGWLKTGANNSGGRPRYAAFRSAQLEALAFARRRYGRGHPFFWAGSIYSGDPGDVPTAAAAVR
jgi:CHAT domain-containing protein